MQLITLHASAHTSLYTFACVHIHKFTIAHTAVQVNTYASCCVYMDQHLHVRLNSRAHDNGHSHAQQRFCSTLSFLNGVCRSHAGVIALLRAIVLCDQETHCEHCDDLRASICTNISISSWRVSLWRCENRPPDMCEAQSSSACTNACKGGSTAAFITAHCSSCGFCGCGCCCRMHSSAAAAVHFMRQTQA